MNRRDPSATMRCQHNAGIALILVLAFLALITVLVISFVSSVSTEYVGAKTYRNGVTAKQLADSAVQLVMGQIKKATTSGTNVAWASQPGMIRTYGDGAGHASSAPLAYYKLYSSDNMVVRQSSIANFDLTDDLKLSAGDAFSAWANQSAIFTDLNAPVVKGTTSIYPIIDPSAQTVPISGFEIQTGGSSAVVASGSANPAPMPVKWIYVLKDGSLTAPTSVDATGKVASWNSSANGPSATNPITGRIAFWTDDETCKINVNTASEGTYWDTPKVYQGGSISENSLALCIPVQHEYQRYPGHPAMTCLSGVFPGVATDSTYPENVYSLIPRLVGGGSVHGTVTTTGASAPATGLALDSDRLYASVDEFLFKPVLNGGTQRALNSTAITNTTLGQSRFFLTTSSRAPDLNLFNKPRVNIWPISANTAAGYRTSFDRLIAFCSTLGSGSNAKLFYFQRSDPQSPTVDLPGKTLGATTGVGRNRMLLEYLRYLTGQPVPGFANASSLQSFATKYSTSNSSQQGTDRDQILTEIFDYIRSTNMRDVGAATASGSSCAFTQGYGSYSNGTGQVVPIDDTETNTHGFGRFRSVTGATLLFIANGDHTTNPVDRSELGSTSTIPAVASGNVRVQACLIPQFFDPSVGAVFNSPYFKFVIEGLQSLTLGGQSLGFAASGTSTAQNTYTIDSGSFWGSQMGIRQLKTGVVISGSIDIPQAETCAFSGGTVTVKVLSMNGDVVQTVDLAFPAAVIPVPKPFQNTVCDFVQYVNGNTNLAHLQPSNSNQSLPVTDPLIINTLTPPVSGTAATGTCATGCVANGWSSGQVDPSKGYTHMRYFRFSGAISGATGVAATKIPGTTVYSPLGAVISNGTLISGTGSIGGRLDAILCNGGTMFLNGYDVVRSVAVSHGDNRLAAAQKNPPASLFTPVGDYTSSAASVQGMHTMWTGNGIPYYGARLGRLVQKANYDNYGITASYYTVNGLSLTTNAGPTNIYNAADVPVNGVVMGGTSSYQTGDLPGDWDNGVGVIRDGPYINKVDEGDLGKYDSGAKKWIVPYSWKSGAGSGILTDTLFSPNRQVPSAVMFGSLPTGVFANRPWQTLLFHPDPTGKHTGNKDVSGNGTALIGAPADHLLLDLFHMPVVEPYAISEPLSTGGRINMNYQIAPFTYIKRETGIRAILKSEKVIRIAETAATNYKSLAGGAAEIRLSVNADETLKGFKARFDGKDIFRSASEICTLPIVPVEPTGSTVTYDQLIAADVASNYWTKSNKLTGDNSRERPYATIYPRLTTKSNTFTVHVRVQILRKGTSSDAKTWDERPGKDTIASEYRGSQTIERYVDPCDSSLADYAASAIYSSNDPAVNSLSNAYQFRVIETKRFTP